MKPETKCPRCGAKTFARTLKSLQMCKHCKDLEEMNPEFWQKTLGYSDRVVASEKTENQ